MTATEDLCRLLDENAELRELVRELFNVMWSCAEERCARRREGCFRVRGNKGPDRSVGSCWYEQRMREMGIEVDA